MVEPLGLDRVAAAADVLARAMEVDPAYRHLLPGEDRERGLRRLFAGNLAAHLPYECSWTWTEAERVVATVTVRPAGGVTLPLVVQLRHGLAAFAWRHGWPVVRRLRWLKRTYDALEHEVSGGAPHRLVHMMAVHPDHQGTGVGGRLLREVLARTLEGEGCPVWLTTHLPRNVTFYERAGFEVVDHRTVRPPEGSAWPVWAMRRTATPPSTAAEAAPPPASR